MVKAGLDVEARAVRVSWRRGRGRLTLAFLSLLLGGCAGAAQPGGAATDTVYIGVATSPASRTGPSIRAVQLAVADLNAHGLPGSRPFGVKLPPAQRPTQVAVAAYFRDDPAVVGVVGHEKSGETLEAAPVYADLGENGKRALVAITPTATSPGLTAVNRWIFRVCPTDVDRGQALARFMADSLSDRRVALLYRNDLMGRTFRQLFLPLVQKAGGTVVERDPYLVGMTEYRAYAERIRREGVPLVVMVGSAADAPEIVRALHAAGVKARLFVGDDASYLAQDPATARDMAGVRYLTFYVPDERAAGEAGSFVRRFRERFHELPDGRDAFSYEAATIIGRAVRAVGPDRHRVRDWIARIGRGLPALPGVTGVIRFNENRTAKGKRVWIGELSS